MAKRKHNFNAGPAALPLSVLEQAQSELVDFEGNGVSIMEMSHRSPEFDAVIEGAKAALGRLYDIPDTHEVLFLQGGASLQFAQVPMNLGAGGAYINTGTWGTKAVKEAKIQGGCHEIWSSKDDQFKHVPQPGMALAVPAGVPYLHYTTNNTIYGTQWSHVPNVDVPVVADLSSDFISKPLDISKFAIIYAGAQKNAGPSGVTVLIIDKRYSREFNGADTVPTILRYPTQAKKDSMFNTPNTFGIYLLGLVAKWAEAQGGLEKIAENNTAKAAVLYNVIDENPGVFQGHARADSRSEMNVTFTLVDSDRTAEFMEMATAAGIMGIKGHRSIGGMRASIYNAVPRAAVDALAKVMLEFAAK
jgi:phosphoserine aminotransferase